MITLSYSTINNCLLPSNSHNWANKINGAKVPENPYFFNGHRLHKIIQEHLSGQTPNEFLKHIPYTFPLVEEQDRDLRCRFKFVIKSSEDEQMTLLNSTELEVGISYIVPNIKKSYEIVGYMDAQDPENLRFGEIKTGSKMWSLGQFLNSYQRKTYALAKPEYTESILITALNETEWATTPPKVFKIPLTQQDRQDALKWIVEAIKLLESGDYTGGLDENGKCANRFCYYGVNCQFK